MCFFSIQELVVRLEVAKIQIKYEFYDNISDFLFFGIKKLVVQTRFGIKKLVVRSVLVLKNS